MRTLWSALAGVLVLAATAVALPVSTSPAVQARDAVPSPCEVRASSEAVSILVCKPGLDDAALVSAGRLACGSRVPCNAWIWDDASKAPKKAPEKDADLPKTTAAAALGIWTNDTKVFIRVRRARP